MNNWFIYLLLNLFSSIEIQFIHLILNGFDSCLPLNSNSVSVGKAYLMGRASKNIDGNFNLLCSETNAILFLLRNKLRKTYSTFLT